MEPAPNLYVVAAPSGGGKTSLIDALLKRDQRINLSISHTTRPPRPGEVDNVHYYFTDDATFRRLVAENAFLEHATVFGHLYGTGRDPVMKMLEQGHDVMLDIDWQGAAQVRESFPSSCSIFILPPSLRELRARLSRRGQDKPEVIEKRMKEAQAEISHFAEFDFCIINDVIEEALDDLHSIIRRRTPKRIGQEKRMGPLLAELLETV